MRDFIRQRISRFQPADQLEIRILNSELNRAKVMRLIGVAALVVWLLANPIFASLFSGAINLWTVLPFIVGFIVYESVAIAGLQQFLSAERIPPNQAFFVNSLIEQAYRRSRFYSFSMFIVPQLRFHYRLCSFILSSLFSLL